MSTDRNTNRPLKPSLASTRTARTPLAPRIAGNATATPTAARPTAPRLPTSRNPAVSPRLKQQDETSPKAVGGTLSATPRAYGRGSRDGGQGSPGQGESLNETRGRGTLGPKETLSSRSSAVSGVGQGLNAMRSTSRPGRPKSTVGDNLAKSPPLIRSPGYSDLNSTAKESIESRFFHASDVQKHEPAPKQPEPKKVPTFFYADGKEDAPTGPPPKAPSPVLSAVSEKRSSNPWMRPETASHPSKSPPMLSPSLAAASTATPFFAAPTTPQSQLRSPSPSRESIHLSYRKGASQIFGTRPSPSSTSPANVATHSGPEQQRPSIAALHRKSTSLSSIESGNSQQARRRSATSAENAHANSPLTHEIKTPVVPRLTSPPVDLPSIDTSLASPALVGSPQGALSPTKHASELAAEARRERKLLDLEISNSSLLAINASLEREVRRQKAELKRFRRLSRAGRLSMPRNELPGRTSEGLSTLGEEPAENDDDDDMMAAGLVDDADDLSDSEDGSLLSGGEPHSPGSQTNKEQDRLAKDEKRLRVDLAKHKELLVQSQAMNQSIKRCMYATEEMLREGKAALQYNVRVSDVKLGGRILSGNDEEEEIEVDDNVTDDGMETAKGFIDVWRGIRTNVEGSEGSGDRDSGIEVDKPLSHVSARFSNVTSTSHDSGRPPGSTTQSISNESTDHVGTDIDLDLPPGAS
ncbi:hypothetical protein M409DRAFT_70394 [Zasmidium cellare ATCC 36951]|uniref:Uncharacterized protein n=1 Tax=Zasmidium cellare ATCC 36951 TaxID=1080233 RepID=A0A6A6C046_ZASCE|nr:uncharacterized protein M409DRAFT_70394 [Zasmidium cellare ATCC 36951]KAF2160427.1 hypothetical protein M409DRAFT_70394 [Zasmidium cellare ATCC 36951]